MKYIPYSINTGSTNMQIDNDLLESAIKNHTQEPIFRLYGWAPMCVSLGRNQKGNFLDEDFLHKNNIDIVRRLTGGRALLHADEITYSVICPTSFLKNGENILSSYKEISQILIEAFKNLGIELDFGGTPKASGNFCMLVSTGADLCYKGKKLIGSAQFRRENYILQHGSILYDFDRKLLEKVFKETVNTSSITSIKDINPQINKNDIIKILRNVTL